MKKLFFNKTEFQWICAQRLGHVLWELKLHSSNANKRKRKLIIFYPNYGITRHLNYLSKRNVRLIPINKYLYFLFNAFTKPINIIIKKIFFRKVRFWGRYSNDFIGTIFDFTLVKKRIYSEDEYFNVPLIKNNFKKFSVNKHSNILKNLQLESKKYVIIHVRETGYFKDHHRRMNKESKIENFSSALDYLQSINLPVVRMGDPQIMYYEHKNLINYCTSKHYSPQNDVILSSLAKFAIVNFSGFRYLPALFNVPMLTLNAFPVTGADLVNQSAILFKKIIKNNKPLSVEDSIGLHYRSDKDYVKNNINIIDNSSSEILNATKFFVEFIENGYSENIVDMKKSFEEIIIKSQANKSYFFPDAFVNMIKL